MLRATHEPRARFQAGDVGVRVGIVGSDEAARAALVQALDRAPSSWDLILHNDIPTDVDIIVCDPGVDASDAIVVSEHERSDLVERIAERIRPGGRALLITSAGGGTGVTSTAIHLAAELAARGRSTCLLDLDDEWGVRGRLGLDPDADPDAPVPVAGGFRLLRGMANFEPALTDFDHVVIDAPRSILDALDGRVRDAMLIMAPTPEGARRARCVLDAHPSFRWLVIANRTGPGGETTRGQLARIVARPVLELPCCPALRDSEDDGRLIARGWSRWSRRVARLAEAGMIDAG